MKKSILSISLLGVIGLTSANYTILVPLEQGNGGTLPNGSININPMSQTEEWLPATPYFTDWVNATAPYDCTNWSPEPSGITVGISYTQTATDCKQDQTRSRQDREQETTTLFYRDVGAPLIENQVITTTDTRDSIGAMESWIATTPTYTSWVNSGVIYGCTNWSPDPNTINSGQHFTQNSTDCKQDQTRNRQDREQETTTLAIRNSGSVIVEIQTLTNQSSARPATGTKPIPDCRYNIATSPGYMWLVSSANDSIWWASTGAGQNTIVPKNSTTFSTGGWTYMRGQFKSSDGYGYSYYEICRVPS